MARTPYVTKNDLLDELKIAKDRMRTSNVPVTPAQCMSPRLAGFFMKMVERFGKRGNFNGYTYLDDMQCHALVTLCANYHKFDELKFDNPFSYYTQIIYTSFIDFLGKERKQRDVKDNLSVSIGLRPSFAAQLNSDAEAPATKNLSDLAATD